MANSPLTERGLATLTGEPHPLVTATHGSSDARACQALRALEAN